MSGQTGCCEILIHQHVDLVSGEVLLGARPTGEEIPHGRAVLPPDLYGLFHIWREIHDAIALPFATIDAYRASAEINSVPGQCAYLGDAQPTAQHT